MQPRQHTSIFSAELNFKLDLELKHMSIVFSGHYVGGMHISATSVDRKHRKDSRTSFYGEIRVSQEHHERTTFEKSVSPDLIG